jgi:hypothetical protein
VVVIVGDKQQQQQQQQIGRKTPFSFLYFFLLCAFSVT